MSNLIKAKHVIYDSNIEPLKEKSGSGIRQPSNFETRSEIIELANIEKSQILLEAEKLGKDEADKIIQQAYKEAEDIKEKALAEAYAEGFEKGKNEGYIEGKELAHEEVKNNNEKLVVKLADTIALIEGEKQYIINEYESNLKSLALSIAEKVVGQELNISEDAILSIIGNAIKDYKNVDWIKIYIPLSDKSLNVETDNRIIELLKGITGDIKIERSKDLDVGDCKIETPDSIVDIGIETQLNNVKSIILDVDNGE